MKMANINKLHNSAERVQQLKAIGQEIIDRAEDLIGDNSFVTGYEITINLFPCEVPEIVLKKRIFPHKVADCL